MFDKWNPREKAQMGYWVIMHILLRWFSIVSADLSQYTLCPKIKWFWKAFFELLHTNLMDGRRYGWTVPHINKSHLKTGVYLQSVTCTAKEKSLLKPMSVFENIQIWLLNGWWPCHQPIWIIWKLFQTNIVLTWYFLECKGLLWPISQLWYLVFCIQYGMSLIHPGSHLGSSW